MERVDGKRVKFRDCAGGLDGDDVLFECDDGFNGIEIIIRVWKTDDGIVNRDARVEGRINDRSTIAVDLISVSPVQKIVIPYFVVHFVIQT